MKLLALGLTAAIAAGAALSATPASAGVYLDYGYDRGGYSPPPPPPHGWGPPPPPPAWDRPYYRPRPVYYGGYGGYHGYDRDRVCTTRYVTKYGYYGPVRSKVTSCTDRY